MYRLGHGLLQEVARIMMTFEVRIPAYNRPHMLSRALHSLLAQNYQHWKAVVFDDSSSSDCQSIVQCIGDKRISYVRNPKNYGAGRNIDQGFDPKAVLGGHYGCLLEDDNFWLPDFLEMLAGRLNENDCHLVLANQRFNDEGIGLRNRSDTTRGGWFSDGLIEPLTLRASLFFMEGVSNGGLVWRLESNVDLRVGENVEHGLHEHSRTLLVKKPFLFIEDAKAVWTNLPMSDSARADDSKRMINRGVQSIRDYLLRSHGAGVISAARSIAVRMGLLDRFVEALAYNGYAWSVRDLLRGRWTEVLRATAKGGALRVVESDPSALFLQRVASDDLEGGMFSASPA